MNIDKGAANYKITTNTMKEVKLKMVRDKEHLKFRVSNDYLVQYKATPTEQTNEHYHDVLECLLIESGNMHTLLNGKTIISARTPCCCL